jgi:hypothetical protein
MEDIHPELHRIASVNKIIGIICLAIAIILVLAAISISIMYAFNFFSQYSEDLKLAISNYSQSALIVAFILGVGAWLMLVKSLNWFKQSTKVLTEAEPVKMNAVIKTEESKENREVVIELADGEKTIKLYMYYPAWPLEKVSECEVEVFKSDEPGPIIIRTSEGILWPYPGIVKQ